MNDAREALGGAREPRVGREEWRVDRAGEDDVEGVVRRDSIDELDRARDERREAVALGMEAPEIRSGHPQAIEGDRAREVEAPEAGVSVRFEMRGDGHGTFPVNELFDARRQASAKKKFDRNRGVQDDQAY